MRLTIKMDVAAKYATQWAIFLFFGKIQRETNVAAKFELCMTLLRRDIRVLLKTAFFGICESVTLFLNTLFSMNSVKQIPNTCIVLCYRDN